ncbi:MAG: V4R domain-containing protein [Gemmatimonadales bacterium]
MNATALLLPHRCVVVSRHALQQLRVSLERGTGVQSATYLQEAGFAGGESVFNAFAEWAAANYKVEKPSELDVQYLGEALSGFFVEFGWGDLLPDQLTPTIVSLDSTNWAEADPEAQTPYPSCHFTSGMLADFFGRLVGGLIGVMEVECRSRGDERCRFLAGSPDVISQLYQQMNRGMTYQQAIEG